MLVGLTDVDPMVMAPSPGNLRVCWCPSDAPPPGDTSMRCGAWGRFLVVFLETLEAILSLCEVQVFGGRELGLLFKVIHSSNIL
jgi:hypothetical protein